MTLASKQGPPHPGSRQRLRPENPKANGRIRPRQGSAVSCTLYTLQYYYKLYNVCGTDDSSGLYSHSNKCCQRNKPTLNPSSYAVTQASLAETPKLSAVCQDFCSLSARSNFSAVSATIGYSNDSWLQLTPENDRIWATPPQCT